ncbi:uncharacterized protein Dana_GF19830 [Drosophila ananassae]|uniref:Peptidase S1 domain-containing protein n=2 Tax=Drosophila ananassae TaxID=7217 RepID=B3MG21_DROAN|nr:uncharacterized protein Dana_GF19830 [Drosophila ananassae]
MEELSSSPQPTTPPPRKVPSAKGGTFLMTPLPMNDNQFKHCGWSNPRGLDSDLRHSQDEAHPAEFRWVIALFYQKILFGGGTLVAPGVVLTAAHVTEGKSLADIVVRAGDWDLESNRQSFKKQERTIVRILRHEAFQVETGANNLALLFLNWPFQLGDHIGTLCLPNLGKSPKIEERCYLVGWGKRKFLDDRFTILKKIELPVVNKNMCPLQVPDSVICAGGDRDNNVCTVDGGSAVVCSLKGNPNLFEQIGIVSFGVQCGTENVPAVYTDVSHFREWINYNLNRVQLEIRLTYHWTPRLPVLEVT